MSGIQIPEHCGAILLPETVLFPHGALPLHIFEERYRTMLEDALESHCMICVGTLHSEESNDPNSCVNRIGTVGLIRTSREMEDGRSNLVLHGVYRIHFSSWMGGKDYPLAHIVPMTTESFPSGEGPMRASRLRDKVNETLSGVSLDIKKQINQVLDQASDEPTILADAVAQQFVQDPDVRYRILSEPSLDARYDLLEEYLVFVQDQL